MTISELLDLLRIAATIYGIYFIVVVLVFLAAVAVYTHRTDRDNDQENA